MPNYKYTGTSDLLVFPQTDFTSNGVNDQAAVTFFGPNDVRTLSVAAYNLLVASGYSLIFTNEPVGPGTPIPDPDLVAHTHGTGLSVELYGAKSDEKGIIDGAMQNNSSVLTWSNTNYGLADPGDVGKRIDVPGAAAGGGTLTTTIASYQSPTQVTLVGAAAATVSGKNVTWATDATAAVQAAIDASNGAVDIPGAYWVDSLVIPSGTVLRPRSPKSQLRHHGATVLIDLVGKQDVHIDVPIVLTLPGQTGVRLDNSFLCHISGAIAGKHTSSTGALYQTQIGVNIVNNAGDNNISSLFSNLGVGVLTASQINYLRGSHFTNCWKGVTGGDPTGVVSAAGMSIEGCTFVGNAATTTRHILIDGSANVWWINNVWMEGASVDVEVGNASGGPMSFSLTNAFIAGTSKCIDMIRARQATLGQIMFGVDAGQTPTELTVGALAPDGFAYNLESSQGLEMATVFPAAWTVLDRKNSTLQPAQWHIPINVLSFIANVGTWVLAQDSSRWFGVEVSSSSAQNDSISWDVGLTAGTWRLDLFHEAFSDVGIYTVQRDGVSVGTIDGYNASAIPLRGQVTFTVSGTGKHRITLLMATKNGSASAYRGRINGAALVRTA